MIARLLAEVLQERRARNPRYSLRALARDVGVPHSALSSIMLGRRPGSAATIEKVADALDISGETRARLVADEHERKIVACIAAAAFVPSVRALAVQTGLDMDRVCVAIQRLLATGRLAMVDARTWRLRT